MTAPSGRLRVRGSTSSTALAGEACHGLRNGFRVRHITIHVELEGLVESVPPR